MRVYLITNTVNGKRYVGQTRLTIQERWRAHVNAAKFRPYCRLLAAAIRKYGAAAFRVEELGVYATQADLDQAEADAIKRLDSLAPSGYNLKTGGGRGAIHDDTKARMRAAHVGRPKTAAHRAAIAAANTGKVYGADRIEAMRAGRWTRPFAHSPETRAKIGAAFRGRPQHPNQIAALRRAHLGAKRTPEQCARIRAGVLAAAERKRLAGATWTH